MENSVSSIDDNFHRIFEDSIINADFMDVFAQQTSVRSERIAKPAVFNCAKTNTDVKTAEKEYRLLELSAEDKTPTFRLRREPRMCNQGQVLGNLGPSTQFVDKELLFFWQVLQRCSNSVCFGDEISRNHSNSQLETTSEEPFNGYFFDAVHSDARISSFGETACAAQNDLRKPSSRNIPDMQVKIYVYHTSEYPKPVDTRRTKDDKLFQRLEIKVYAYAEHSSLSAAPQKLRSKFCIDSIASDTTVQTLIEKIVNLAIKRTSPSFDATGLCLRIQGRTDLLFPRARISEHGHVWHCYRQNRPVHLVLERYTQQELFLRSSQENFCPFFSSPAGEENEEDKAAARPDINVALSIIARFAGDFRKLLLGSQPKVTVQKLSSTISNLEQAIKAFGSLVCEGITITAVLDCLNSLRSTLYEYRRKVNFGTNANPGGDSQKSPDQNLLRSLEDDFSRLEKSLLDQIQAFFQWKQLWAPDLDLSFHSTKGVLKPRPRGICEDTWTIKQITAFNEQPEFATWGNQPFIVGILSIRRLSPEFMSMDLKPAVSASYIRVYLTLTYAGRPLDSVCGRDGTGAKGLPLLENNVFSPSVSTIPVSGNTVLTCRGHDEFNSNNAPSMLRINQWFRFSDYHMSRLPCETLLGISVLSFKKPTDEPAVLRAGILLGWANIPIFDVCKKLRQGKMLVGLWKPDSTLSQHPELRAAFSQPDRSSTGIVVEVAFPEYCFDFTFPTIEPAALDPRDFNELPQDTRSTVESVAQDILLRRDDSELLDRDSDCKSDFITYVPPLKNQLVKELWERRDYLCSQPTALTALLIGCLACWPNRLESSPGSGRGAKYYLWSVLLPIIYALITHGEPPSAHLALRLLGPDVPDQSVRRWAVSCFAQLPPDDLIPFLPRLVEAVNFDVFMDWSGLVSLLVQSACISMKLCTALLWELQSQLGLVSVYFRPRLKLLHKAILCLRGEALVSSWRIQRRMLDVLMGTAREIREASFSSGLKTISLVPKLAEVNILLQALTSSDGARAKKPLVESKPDAQNRLFRMPFDFGVAARSIDLRSCTVFSSFNRPLQVTFLPPDSNASPFSSMFKVGDDLRMDALICHLMEVADSIWLSAGLDFRMVHFKVLPISPDSGIVELVPDCLSLRKIQDIVGGRRGAFNEKGILNWLESFANDYPPNQQKETFVLTLVASSVLTYVLGIGDRHNDNIMVCKSGQLFNIDFAKIFGNFQTIIGINRDRAPFVLTPDMLRVVKDALSTWPAPSKQKKDKGLDDLQQFVGLCREAYNLLRKNAHALLNILEMARYSGMPGLTSENVKYVVDALRLEDSDDEARLHFTSLIRESKKTMTTQINFFMHSWAQRRLSPGRIDEGSPANAGLGRVYMRTRAENFGPQAEPFLEPSDADSTYMKTGDAGLGYVSELDTRSWKINRFVVENVLRCVEKDHSSVCFTIVAHLESPPQVYRIERTLEELEALSAQLKSSFPFHSQSTYGEAFLEKVQESNKDLGSAKTQLEEWLGWLLVPDIIASEVFHSFLQPKKAGDYLLSPDSLTSRNSVHLVQHLHLTGPFNDRNGVELSSECGKLADTMKNRLLDWHPYLQLVLFVDEGRSRLEVRALNGRNWSIAHSRFSSAAYLKLRLSSADHELVSERKTFKNNNENIVLNEKFTFLLGSPDLTSCELDVRVCSCDPDHSSDAIVGQAKIPLSQLTPGVPLTSWYDLSPP
nr:unnamed protein product [Spirometra erinaceieuropaei]